MWRFKIMQTLINNFDTLLQIVCDPENQPHQFIGDENGLREMFEVKMCECIEPQGLDEPDDKIIRVCGKCNRIVDSDN